MEMNEHLPALDSRCEVCFLIMCGLPGAGKTTFSKKFASVPPPNGSSKRDPTILLVQFDDIIPERLTFDKEDSNNSTKKSSTAWKKYREEIYSNVNQFMGKLMTQNLHSLPQQCATKTTLESTSEHSTICKNVGDKFQVLTTKENCGNGEKGSENEDSFVIVLDDNMFYRSMRYEYYQLARKYGAGFAQIFIECPVPVAVARNDAREHHVTMETITSMAAHLEEPDSCKATWERFTTVLDAKKDWDEDDLKLIWCTVEEAFTNPAPPYQELDYKGQEESRKASLASVLHQADVVLRKCVAEAMKKVKAKTQPSKSELRKIAGTLNALRTNILDEIKQKQLVLPPLLSSNGNQESFHNEEFQEALQTQFTARGALK